MAFNCVCRCPCPYGVNLNDSMGCWHMISGEIIFTFIFLFLLAIAIWIDSHDYPPKKLGEDGKWHKR